MTEYQYAVVARDGRELPSRGLEAPIMLADGHDIFVGWLELIDHDHPAGAPHRVLRTPQPVWEEVPR
jgi:hypothetical protein